MSIWLILIILVLALTMLWWIGRMGPRRARFSDKERAIISDRWQYIEGLAMKDRHKEAIMEADKLVDFAFREMKLRGETFADRLKSAEKLLPNYQDIWSAHKLRNQLAHEIDTEVNPRTAESALQTFKQTLKHLKAI